MKEAWDEFRESGHALVAAKMNFNAAAERLLVRGTKVRVLCDGEFVNGVVASDKFDYYSTDEPPMVQVRVPSLGGDVWARIDEICEPKEGGA